MLPVQAENEVRKKSVYEYRDVRDLLRDTLAEKKRKNPRYSIRAWARQLGYKSPSLLLGILHGRRRLNSDLGVRMASSIPMTSHERKYFNTLVLACAAKTQPGKDFYFALLDLLRPDPVQPKLQLAKVRSVAQWYHLALVEILALRDFNGDPQWLSSKFRGKVQPSEVSASLARLHKLGLIELCGPEGCQRWVKGPTVFREGISHEVFKDHHRELMPLARQALSDQPANTTDFRATKIALRRDDFGKAKEIIREFHRAIQRLSVKHGADDVYAFNSHFFSLTRRLAERDSRSHQPLLAER